MFDIQMFVPGLDFSGDALKTQSLGGSETAGLCLAKEFVALGHRVRMFCNTTKPGMYDGVEYRNIGEWALWSQRNPHDVSIVQRLPGAFAAPLSSKLNYLWCHDLALRRQEPEFKSVLWNVDRVVVLSDFMKDQYKEVYGLPEEVFYKTRNGVDVDLIDTIPKQERDKNYFLYVSRPERGLDVLLKKIWPELLKRIPTAVLKVCTYHNPVDLPSYFSQEIDALKAKYGVIDLGHLNKVQLYTEMKKACVLLYPTPSEISPEFREVSCIAAMEAQVCGLPIVTSAIGALPETAPYGATIQGKSTDPEYIEQFVDEAFILWAQRDIWEVNSDGGIDYCVGVQGNNWKLIAEEWIDQFNKDMEQKSSSFMRNLTHLHKHSDIDAIEEMYKRSEGALYLHEELAVKEILAKYEFRRDPEAFIAHYQGMGDGTDADLEAKDKAGFFPKEFLVNNPQPRFQQILSVLKASGFGSDASILDYGCGHGWSPLFLAGNLGCKVVGYDIDESAMRWCRHFTPRVVGENNDKVQFTNDFKKVGTGHDVLVCSEVLEHVVDWKETIQRAERCVRIGGLVVITVPFGPWEFGGPNWTGRRAHIREFSGQDLREIFGKKEGLKISAVFEDYHPKLAEPLGFFFVTYVADHKNVGEIDYDRKLSQICPRETLAINIIAGPGCESTLRWCLESVQNISERIIIGNTGLSEEGLRIARDFGCELIDAPDPRLHGFDEARNVPLSVTTEDWTLWIDTDERLANPQQMIRYLRPNIFKGYSIRQHHFAVDFPFPPDIPVRLFRTKGMKFFGSVHEHPETDLNKGPGLVCMTNDLAIGHVGYLNEGVRIGRFARNSPLMEMDAKKYPDRILRKYLQMRDNQIRVGMLLQQFGHPTEEVRKICEETVQLYRENFLDGQKLYGIDPRPQYSTACEILGIGFRASIEIKVNKMGIGDNFQGGQTFANEEDFKREVARIVTEKTELTSGRYW